MNILLLGAGGFIGSHLVEHLLKESKHEVVGLDLGSREARGDFKQSSIRVPPRRYPHRFCLGREAGARC